MINDLRAADCRWKTQQNSPNSFCRFMICTLETRTITAIISEKHWYNANKTNKQTNKQQQQQQQQTTQNLKSNSTSKGEVACRVPLVVISYLLFAPSFFFSSHSTAVSVYFHKTALNFLPRSQRSEFSTDFSF